jgi:hypothetical protein
MRGARQPAARVVPLQSTSKPPGRTVLLGWPASPSMIRWSASDWPFKLPNDTRGQCEAPEGEWEEACGRGEGGADRSSSRLSASRSRSSSA